MREFKHQDFEVIEKWFLERGIKSPRIEDLPPTGLINSNLAAGFLITTDNNCGVLDFFCSNPKANRLDRLEALDEIAFHLTIKARRLGLKSLLCSSKFENIKKMANKQGFDYVGEHSTFCKGL